MEYIIIIKMPVTHERKIAFNKEANSYFHDKEKAEEVLQDMIFQFGQIKVDLTKPAKDIQKGKRYWVINTLGKEWEVVNSGDLDNLFDGEWLLKRTPKVPSYIITEDVSYKIKVEIEN